MKVCPVCQRRYPDDISFCYVEGGSLTPLADPRVGTSLEGRYVIEELIGEGGMAAVYRARHKLIERPCAIKIVHADVVKEPNVAERFRREARHAQRLAHPNIIEVFDQGEAGDTLYLVMELLEGQSLAEVIATGPISPQRAIPILIQMGRALARAHDFEVVHRDLKPENVFVLPGDRVKLLDFGIARSMQDTRLTSLGEIFGTPEYMAPEQGNSNDAGTSADLYAWGVMMYEMLTGTLPYEAQNAPTLLVKHMTEPVPHMTAKDPSMDPDLDALVFSLMAKTPEERPVDAHTVIGTLKELCTKLGIQVPIEPTEEPDVATPRRLVSAGDNWVRRTELFGRMLSQGFGANVPPDMQRMLETLRQHVNEIEELRKRALEQQEKLEVIEAEGREGRLRFGHAMDELSTDVSEMKREARQARSSIGPLSEKVQSFPDLALKAHLEVVTWEGRCGFAEPYPQLSKAYRDMADLVDQWFEARRAEKSAEEKAVDAERMLVDVDYQIQELRQGLEHLDKSIHERRAESHHAIAEMGRRAEELESELLHLASRFTAPLRAKPELGPLFRELERDGAPA